MGVSGQSLLIESTDSMITTYSVGVAYFTIVCVEEIIDHIRGQLLHMEMDTTLAGGTRDLLHTYPFTFQQQT